MGRTQTAGAPSPHRFHHQQPPPQPPPPATFFPPTNNNINHHHHHQQQQGYNVITTPPPQYHQNNNGHAMNIMRPQPQPQHQPLSHHAAIGVPQITQQVNGTGQGDAKAKGGSTGNAMVMPWTTGLFDCMDDPNNALMTAFFPCITFGQIADVLDNGHTTCATSAIIYAVAPCLVSRVYRRKLRQRFGLVEAPASDWTVHSLFEYCAICQEHRELTNRGINPALGHRGNQNNDQSQLNFAMVPPNNQTMG